MALPRLGEPWLALRSVICQRSALFCLACYVPCQFCCFLGFGENGVLFMLRLNPQTGNNRLKNNILHKYLLVLTGLNFSCVSKCLIIIAHLFSLLLTALLHFYLTHCHTILPTNWLLGNMVLWMGCIFISVCSGLETLRGKKHPCCSLVFLWLHSGHRGFGCNVVQIIILMTLQWSVVCPSLFLHTLYTVL